MDYKVLHEQIKRVSKVFYDKIYKDAWLKQVFRDVKQEHIENQQTDFMLGAFGGPKNYAGRNPQDAHPHIFVDQDMWDLREKYLVEAFAETEFPVEFRDKWLKIDNAFKHAILKRNLSDCYGRFKTDEIIYVPNPNGVKKAA